MKWFIYLLPILISSCQTHKNTDIIYDINCYQSDFPLKQDYNKIEFRKDNEVLFVLNLTAPRFKSIKNQLNDFINDSAEYYIEVFGGSPSINCWSIPNERIIDMFCYTKYNEIKTLGVTSQLLAGNAEMPFLNEKGVYNFGYYHLIDLTTILTSKEINCLKEAFNR